MSTVNTQLQEMSKQAEQASEQELNQTHKEAIFDIAGRYQKKLDDEKKKAIKRAGMSGAMASVGGAMIIGGLGASATGIGAVPGAVVAGVGAALVFGSTRV